MTAREQPDQSSTSAVRGIPVPSELLEDGQWTPGVIAWLAGQLYTQPKPTFTGVLAYLEDGSR